MCTQDPAVFIDNELTSSHLPTDGPGQLGVNTCTDRSDRSPSFSPLPHIGRLLDRFPALQLVSDICASARALQQALSADGNFTGAANKRQCVSSSDTIQHDVTTELGPLAGHNAAGDVI